ncbi:MAG: NAD(+) diphosphatase [Planctomycetes bacterium]|nr:NAD(+) diphosphatase [Planctomycetota bacterium]
MDNYERSLRNYFTKCDLDRVADRRQDAEWLDLQLKKRTTLFVPVWNSKNFFTDNENFRPNYLSPQEVSNLVPAPDTTILLGVKEKNAYFAIDLSLADESTLGALKARGKFQDIRIAAPLLDEHDGTILAFARAMTYWHQRHRFCGDCGSPTESTEGGFLRICTDDRCRQRHFPRTDPAIIVLVTSGERCLLGRQPSWPKGMYSIIAGFVEPGESLEDALVREVREETGIDVCEMIYHSSQPWPFPSSLMLGFTATAANETIQMDTSELEDVRWFSRKALQEQLASGTAKIPPRISIAYRLIESWFDLGEFAKLSEISSDMDWRQLKR